MHVCLLGIISRACASIPQVVCHSGRPHSEIRGSPAACVCLRGHLYAPCLTVAQRLPGWRTRHPESLCFSPTGELLLYGPTLWDPRAPRSVHTFDLLSYNPCASTFHPAGLEAVVNAEVGLPAHNAGQASPGDGCSLLRGHRKSRKHAQIGVLPQQTLLECSIRG